MGVFNFFRKKMASEDAKALVWDYLDNNPNATVALMMQDLPEIDANVIKANKRNWQNAQRGQSTSTAKKEEASVDSSDVKKARNDLEVKKLELEREKILKELDDAKGYVQAQIEKVRLEADVKMLDDKKKRLQEDIEDAEQELKELETEIDEAEKEAERLNIKLDGDESDPMSMMLQGFMSNAMQKAQQPPTAPPVQTSLPADQTTLTPQPTPSPQPEQKTAPEPSYDVEKEADELLARMTPQQKIIAKTAGREEVLEFARVNGIPKDIALTAWKKNKKVR